MNRAIRLCAAPLLSLAAFAGAAQADEPLPYYLQDRGTGVYTSMFGTYVRKGEWLLYPFYEYTTRSAEEYKGSELGYSNDDTDYLGKSHTHELLIFTSHAFTEDFAFEFESALYSTATLEKARDDTTSGIPSKIEESGLGDTEGQLRYRLVHETEYRPELLTFFEVEFPLQKNRVLIGSQEWAYALGFTLAKGFTWGTLTARAAEQYDEGDIEFGEFGLEYLKKLSPAWRWVTTLEGESDELSIIAEAQWHITPRAYWKFNSGFGLTEKAEDFAPEIGYMMSFGNPG